MDTYLIIAALGSIGTLGTVLILFYIQIIKPWLNEPVINIEFNQKEPYCKEVGWVFKDPQGNTIRTPSYWIRVKVKNEGGSVAKNCEGQLIDILDYWTEESVEKFVPLILRWSSRPATGPIDINRESSWFLDVIFINRDNKDVRSTFGTTFSKKAHINDIFREHPTGTLKDLKAGRYYLKIMIYGDNFRPQIKKIYMNWSGKWKKGHSGRESIIVKMKGN